MVKPGTWEGPYLSWLQGEEARELNSRLQRSQKPPRGEALGRKRQSQVDLQLKKRGNPVHGRIYPVGDRVQKTVREEEH